MKHVIVRGRSVQLLGTGTDLKPAPVQATRGSLVVSVHDNSEISSVFVARIAGESWEGLGTDPVSALASLAENIWASGYAGSKTDIPSLMRSIDKEFERGSD